MQPQNNQPESPLRLLLRAKGLSDNKNYIEKNKIFFGKNYRMAMMVKILEKMDKDKKKKIYSAADNFIKRNTN